MADIKMLCSNINERFAELLQRTEILHDELTLEVAAEHLLQICSVLRDEAPFAFNMLIDVCGLDYLHYGLSEWETHSATATGFERGVDSQAMKQPHLTRPRFGVVYHLLSLTHNHRVRIRVLLEEHALNIPSVVGIWPAANWFEREAFDLFGIIFVGHPDLRRLLTDYGFIGHPFRKDFPLSGQVAVRYDAKLQRVVYEPVDISPRILEPKVIRRDNRYESGES